MLKEIIKDVIDLEAKEVTIFGQKQTLRSNKELRYTPRVKNFLRALKDYEVTKAVYKEVINAFDNEDSSLEVVNSDNTYNWNSSIDHDMNFKHVKFYDKDFIILSVHRFGDVRGNYTEEAVVQMSMEGFFEVLFNECTVYESITVDNVDYELTIYATSDQIDVFNPDNNESFEVYTVAEEEYIIKAIKEETKE
jgi:hypothetical protein